MTRGPEARLCAGRQQAGAERRLGRGDAGRGARRRCWTIDLGFDIGITGFSIPEIDSLIEGLSRRSRAIPADDWLPDAADARCRPGDIWQLGPAPADLRRRARAPTSWPLMDGEQARMVFTDPPYNVPIDGHVGGSGGSSTASSPWRPGEMSAPEFTGFLRTSFRNLADAQRRRLHPLRLHGLAAHGRDAGGRRGRLRRAQEPDRLGQGQRRHGHLLPLPPRADLRLQERHRAAHQQPSSWASTALPHQRLGVPRASTR